MPRKKNRFFKESIMRLARTDVKKFVSGTTIKEALHDIKSSTDDENRIDYFYIVDCDDRLTGVIPIRRLLTSDDTKTVDDIMITSTLASPMDCSVLDAHEYFTRHKLLAFPVVDDERRILGVVDIGMFSKEDIDATDRENMHRAFEIIGLSILQVREASPLRAFRYRFPWLLATIASGTTCAILAGAYEATLAQSLVLAFFMTLVLGLGESVSIQSMTLAIHTLRSLDPDWKWYVKSFYREVGSAVLLGAACWLIVGSIVVLWRDDVAASAVIGSSILLTLCCGVFWGLSIPSLLHKLKLDMRIASGPLTLALSDISTILIYFGMATFVIGT